MIRKLLVLLLCLTAATATAKKPKSSASKKTERSAEKPKESDYDKLFKEKHTVADGMCRLHDVKGKLYFEIPDSLFGREMLLGSTISEVSDNAAATTGSKSDYPRAPTVRSSCVRSTARTSPTRRGLPARWPRR